MQILKRGQQQPCLEGIIRDESLHLCFRIAERHPPHSLMPCIVWSHQNFACTDVHIQMFINDKHWWNLPLECSMQTVSRKKLYKVSKITLLQTFPLEFISFYLILVNYLLCTAIVLTSKGFFLRAGKVCLINQSIDKRLIINLKIWMIPDGLRNHHKADILIINTFPQQLDYSDTRKQQSLVFPLDPKSNLCFPMLRLGNRPRTSHTKQEYRSNVKQIHLSLHANRADPEQADVPGSTLLRLSWIWLTAHRSYSRALKKNQLS